MKFLGYAIAAIFSAILLIGSTMHKLPMQPAEAWGFVTGALCVWLTVKENIWNWPIGIVNNLFYIVLFLEQQLYGDMVLQIVYVVLGALGWYWWLHGGQGRSVLHVTHTPRVLAIIMLAAVIAATYGMTEYFRHIHDSAPFLDAITTTLSLAAQFLLTKKMLENWYIWITADVIYIGLYASKHLYLTSALYAIFIVMCIIGLRDWKRSQRRTGEQGAYV